jgi:hypothetical protein
MPTTLIQSWADLREARLMTLRQAGGEVAIFDRDLSTFSLGQRDCHAALSAFLAASPKHRVRLVVHAADRALRANPRLARLLTAYAHAIGWRQTPENLRHLGDQLLIVRDSEAVVHFQFDQPRAKLIVADPGAVRPYLRRFEELWLESVPAAGPTALGL